MTGLRISVWRQTTVTKAVALGAAIEVSEFVCISFHSIGGHFVHSVQLFTTHTNAHTLSLNTYRLLPSICFQVSGLNRSTLSTRLDHHVKTSFQDHPFIHHSRDRYTAQVLVWVVDGSRRGHLAMRIKYIAVPYYSNKRTCRPGRSTSGTPRGKSLFSVILSM